MCIRDSSEIEAYEEELSERLRIRLQNIRGVRLLGHSAVKKVGVVSFIPNEIDPGELCDELAKSCLLYTSRCV